MLTVSTIDKILHHHRGLLFAMTHQLENITSAIINLNVINVSNQLTK